MQQMIVLPQAGHLAQPDPLHLQLRILEVES